jgi:putative RNA ligase
MYNGLFTHEEFVEAQEEGLVRSRAHPEADLYILNYTEKATYDGIWNKVTLNCRGLIVDLDGNVIARPFPKFFNYGQHIGPIDREAGWNVLQTQKIDLDEEAVITDKMDGSLGILYQVPGETQYSIATRGSFTSEQAIHATEILRTKYADYIPPGGITMLFEIVYPENRIVCNYGEMDDLVLLGSVHNDSGDSWEGADLDWDWPGPIAEIFPYKTMREALAAKPREGKEGFVVHLYVSGIRVKIKQEDYIALHRIVTGLNARSVWEAMLTDSVDELIEKIPDEFHDFIRGVCRDINEDVDETVDIINRAYDRILDQVGVNATKKEFALVAKNHRYSTELFDLWGNRDIRPRILERAKPKHDYSPIKVDNDSN